MKHMNVKLAVLALIFSMPSLANANQANYVYKKNNECTIDSRSPEKFTRARGSSWKFVGKTSTRTDALKLKKSVGCK